MPQFWKVVSGPLVDLLHEVKVDLLLLRPIEQLFLEVSQLYQLPLSPGGSRIGVRQIFFFNCLYLIILFEGLSIFVGIYQYL